jgi:predicted RNase H-like nuclease (RuvC/YqgF family)
MTSEGESTDESNKRMREPDGEEHTNFLKSRKTTRTPVKSNNDELIIRELRLMRQEMKDGFQENKKELEQLKNEIKELKKKEEEWKEEKQQLNNRIEKMEYFMEKQERKEKKNNIVIKGLKTNEEQIKEDIENFLKNELKVQVKVVDAFKVGQVEEKKAIIATIETYKQKTDIMVNKKNLKGKKIYIENDLTKKEREIQTKIIKIAKEENNAGNKTRIGYQKLIINNQEYEWNKQQQNLQRKDVKKPTQQSKN